MASEDVLERADRWCKLTRWPSDDPAVYRLDAVGIIRALAAEIERLRAKLDSEASHRLSLCADNERFVAEIERLRADLVWAVMRKASFDPERRLFEFDQHDGAAEDGSEDDSGGMFPIDGTPDSICRAVREARDGVS